MARKKKTQEEEQVVVVQHTKTEEELKNEQRLTALYSLQLIDSQVDKIRIVRGELPLEVEDLQDEVMGLETRANNMVEDIENLNKQIREKKEAILNSLEHIKRYEEQQMNVRNNREYDSLSKEIEFQTLEMQLAEKHISEFNDKITSTTEALENTKAILAERQADLELKKSELKDIITETEEEEKQLLEKSSALEPSIDPRLLKAYKRIRNSAKNGLSVVAIERDACGGCFNKIPPQHQMEIKMHKKIIVCEYCGRILIDTELADSISV